MSAPRPAPHTPPAPRSPPAGSAPPGGTGGQRPWPAPPTGPAGRRRRLWRGQRGQQDGQRQGQSVMMTGRAWFLGSDLAGVGTAMITHKGRARAPTAHHRHTTRRRVTPQGLCRPPGPNRPRTEAEFGRKFDGHLYYLPADVTSADLADARWSLAV